MIKVVVHGDGHVELAVQGKPLDLLAEIPIGFGGLLARVLHNCPDEEYKKHLLKKVLECTLMEIREEEANL